MKAFEVVRGSSPLVLGIPHAGTYLPDKIFRRLTTNGQQLIDTDWRVERLYKGLIPDVTTVRATFHRYLIDANRDPSGASLYPGQNTTELVPLKDFDGNSLWNQPPAQCEINAYLAQYHGEYHSALKLELERVKSVNGIAVLYDCHSIRSVIPFLFEGVLPDLNIGDNEGRTCDRRITLALQKICEQETKYQTVVNGRFRGGWTIRNYGRPKKGIHAIQMELAQSTYLTEESPPFRYDEVKAANLRTILASILGSLTKLAGDLKKSDEKNQA